MAESQRDETQPQPEPSLDAGSRLRLAREAKGLSRADVAATTKIPERHIAALEAGNYSALAGRSYALGFSRTYARAVGLDEHEVMAAVRQELGAGDPALEHRHAFEPGDPSRVPSKKVAWLAALIAFAVTLGVLFFWRGRQEPVAEPAPADFASEEPPVEATGSDPLGTPTDATFIPAVPLASDGVPPPGAGLAPQTVPPQPAPQAAPRTRRAPAAGQPEPARLGGILPPEPGEANPPAEAGAAPAAPAPSTDSD